MGGTTRMHAVFIVMLLLSAVCISHARQVPGLTAAATGQPDNSDNTQQRALLSADRIQAANKHSHKDVSSKAVHTAQLGSDVADPPPFVGADVRKGASVEPLQVGPGFNGGGPGFNGGGFNGGNFDGGNFGGGGFGGTPQWLNVAGVTANAVGYGVNVGTALVAPIVNGVASNIPLMLPSLADGQCFRGQPIFIPRLNRVMCVVGSAAGVTNYMFRAANVLVNAAAGGVGLAAQIASVAGK